MAQRGESMNTLTTVILAAGFGKRMKSKHPKVLHQVSGLPMIKHVIQRAYALSSTSIVCVVGHGKERVMDALSSENVSFAIQEEQLGTGHAVMMAEAFLDDGDCLVLFGDTPLLTDATLSAFVDFHREHACDASLLSTRFEDPSGYGRIFRDEQGQFQRIIEHKDCDENALNIKEIYSGIGIFKGNHLKSALKLLKNDNQQNEYYLTDAFELIKKNGGKVQAFITDNQTELMGINDRLSLAVAEKEMQQRILAKHMLNGVTIISPETTHIEAEVTIGQDVTLLPQTILQGKTEIEDDCVIGPGATISNSFLKKGSTVKHSTLDHALVGERTTVGPYAFLRPGSQLGNDVKVGDFVEIKNSKIGNNTKISHLTYVGDGIVGENVNLGCGVVFVNYDGHNKHITHVKDNVFVGCNSNLVAPVTIEKGAYIAAGSTITEDVPENALAIARERQVNKTEWSNKYAKK